MKTICVNFDDVEKYLAARSWFYDLKTDTKEEEEYKNIIKKEINEHSRTINEYMEHLKKTNDFYLELEKQLFKIIRKIGKID